MSKIKYIVVENFKNDNEEDLKKALEDRIKQYISLIEGKSLGENYGDDIY